MSKFKSGDWVKRITDHRYGVEVGDINQIHSAKINGDLVLAGRVSEGAMWHDSKFVLHSRPDTDYPSILKDNKDLYLSRGRFVLYSHIKDNLKTIAQDSGGLLFHLSEDTYTFSLEDGTKLLNRLSEEGVLSGNTIQ